MDPLPDPWLQTGTIAAAIINSQLVSGRPARPSDFIPMVRRVESVESQKARWKAYIKAKTRAKKKAKPKRNNQWVKKSK